MAAFSFAPSHFGAGPRTGILRTAHGEVRTPAFMPVGTQGTIKSLRPEAVRAAGTEMILANTYHLALRPGAATIARAGGVARFIGWPGPVLTDSGGYQAFSLSPSIDDDGVRFRSHLDGAPFRLTPEGAIAIQEDLGSDIAMVLDECPPDPLDRDRAASAVERTIRWARRSIAARARPDQAVFAIVQGGVHEDLRGACAEALREMPFEGLAIGGVSVGEEKEAIHAATSVAAPHLPADRPRYLMGVGEPDDILWAVRCGIDLFDCVIPTRCARNGRLYTFRGRMRIRNARFRKDDQPIEEGCDCMACARVSRAYLAHLHTRGETLGATLATHHNLRFFQRLMEGIRRAIDEDRFDTFARSFAEGFVEERESP